MVLFFAIAAVIFATAYAAGGPALWNTQTKSNLATSSDSLDQFPAGTTSGRSSETTESGKKDTQPQAFAETSNNDNEPSASSDSGTAHGSSSSEENTNESAEDNSATNSATDSASSATQTPGTEAAGEPAVGSSVTYEYGGGGGGGGGGGSKSKKSDPPSETVTNSTGSGTDTTPPNIIPPGDAEFEATGTLTITDLGVANVTDSVDPAPDVVNDAPPNGFPVGVTTIRWTATDDAGNSATKEQKISIRDTTAPSITVSGEVVAEAKGILTKIVFDLPGVSDIADDSPTLTNDSPIDGFPLGKTLLTWTVTDDSGNSRTALQNVTVLDTTPPAITAPADTIHYVEEGIQRAVVQLGIPAVSDAADSRPKVTNNAPDDGFPVGTTTVVWTARDASGNSASDTQKITVVIVVREPGPEPPSKWKGLHGVNFVDPVLKKDAGLGLSSYPQLDTMINTADTANFNLFRVPVFWSAYAGNEQNVLKELELIAQKTQAKGIKIWIANVHFETTSYWKWYEDGVLRTHGSGFPKYVVNCYVADPNKSYITDPAVVRFWDDYYTNKVKDSKQGCTATMDVWKEQADMMKAIIAKVDKYPNVLGYEILNEPHVWRDSHYDGLGNMHTEVGKQLRSISDKTIIFTRETAWGYNAPDGKKYYRQPSLEHKLLARITGDLRYIPHLYGLNDIEKHVSQWKKYQAEWEALGYKVPLGVGEFATQPPQLPSPSVTVANVERYVSVWAREEAASPDGFPVTYWAFGSCCGGEGNHLTTNTGELTDAGRYYRDAIAKYY
jgi:hypothetical protein